MPELATAWVVVTAETSQVPGQIRRAFGQAQPIADQHGRSAGRSFASSFGASLKGLGGALGVTGGIAAVGAAMKSAISSGMDFTTSLNSMQAVAGATSAQVAQVGAMARQLGNDNTIAATSSVDAAQAMLELAKGGFSVDQSMQAARGTLQLAAAAQISAGEAATIQSQALQAFGLNANQAGMAADILANSANQSSAEITDVAQALQQSGAVAHQFGLSMNDTAAAISLMANSGIQGSDAGTLLKSALLALTDQSKPAQGAMEELGLQVYDAQGKFVGLSSLFGQLQTASKNMTSEQYQAATATLFGSDAMRIAGIAAQQGKTGFDAMAAAMGKQGAAADVANAKMQGLPGAWERFKNAAQDAGLSFYDAVQGPLTKAASWGAEAIGKLVDTASNAGPKIKQTWENITAAFQEAGGPEILAMWGDRLEGVFESLWGSVEKLLPTVGNLSAVFAQASAIVAAVGIESFVEALEAAAGILDTTIVPVIQLANSALSGMHPVVVGAVAAWLGFRLVGPALAGVRTQVASLAATATTATGRITTLAAANRALVQTSTIGAVQMGRFGSAIALAGTHAPVIARMQSSFVGAAAGASTFGRTAGAAAAAGTGLRAAGSAIAGVFGGPLGLGLTAAAVGGTYVAAQFSEARQKTEALADANRDLVEAQHGLLKAFTESRGAVNDSVISAQTSAVDKYRATLDATAARHKSFMEGLVTFDTNRGQLNSLADEAEAAQRAFDDLGLSNEELSKRISRGDESRNQLRNQLRAMGPDGQSAARAFDDMSISYVRQQQRAETLTPGIADLGDAIRTMGDQGATASDRLAALKAAMDALNPARNQAEAVAQYGETIRKATESVSGVDGSAFSGGQFDAMSESGATLSRTLGEIAEKTAQMASSTSDATERSRLMAQANRDNEQVFQQLAAATGQPIEKIRELYAEMGGQTVDLTVSLAGAPKVIQDLGTVSEAFRKTPESKTVTMDAGTVTPQTMDLLRRMNATVTTMPNGDIQITANDAIAQQRILMVTQNVNVLNALKANPTLDLNTLQFNAKDAQSRGILQQLNGMVADPQAGLIIQDLLNGQAVSMTKLDELRKSTANPNAILLIDELLKNAGIANTTLDQTARTRDANIRVNVVPGTNGVPGAYQFGLNVPAGADGMIRQYANGGINALEQYANGKLPNQAVLQKAVPNTLIQWAEPETGGEAFIPLAGSKRSRSTDILAAVAKIFGYALVPQDNLPSTVSGMLGSLTGNALSRMLSLTGVDKLGVTAYANGGMDAAGLRKLAEGTGASRPLTGAPYVWGGVNWGDCSGAMSAFARAAVGLDPFGGRFSTASEASQLQSMGFTMGHGSSGDLRFGWHNGGPGGGHTSGTLPDGTNIEMGGGNGGGMLGGGAAGADDAQHNEFAYLTIGPGLPTTGTGATDPGGFVTRPDGTIVYQPGNGNYGATGGGTGSGSGSTTGSSGTSISSRFGSAVGAFVEGQIADVFQTLGANDSPGIVGAIADYENAQRAKDKGVDTTALKTSYENAKKESDQKFEAEKLKRKQDYDEQVRKLQAEKRATKDAAKKAEIDAKLADLKKKHEDDELAKKQEHDNNQLDAKQKYDQAAKTAKSANSAAGQQDQQNPVTDPGTSKPAPGQDLGGDGGAAAALASTGNQIKDAFRSGLREAWRTGQPWTDTDYIVGRESGWKVDATNPSSGAFGLGQWNPSSGTLQKYLPDKSTDPAVQGKAFDRYVGDVYTDPMGARSHWDQYGWYDRGGIIHEGTTLMRNELGHKETALPFDPRDLKASLDRGGSGNNADLIAEIRELRFALLSMEPGDNVTLRDEHEYYQRKQRRQNARIAAARGGRG